VMIRVRRLFARLRSLFGNARREEELEREIATHLALLEDEFQNKGLPPGEARLAARRAYGGVEQAKQLHREERSYQGLAQAAQDIRYAFRQLSRARGFTVAAVLTLALGIGANTAIFSIIDAVLLKPLSYPDPDRIVQFMLMMPQGPARGASVPDFHLWQQQTRVFQDVSAYDVGGHGLNLTGKMPERIHGLHVTADYFRLFGAPMLFGRAFTTQEDSPNGGKVVVISYGLWNRKFGGDPNIVGKAISLEKEPFTVIGVTGPSFQPDPVADAWIPFQFDPNGSDQAHFYFVAGRLKPGVTLDQANAELKLAANEARRKFPLADPELGYRVEPLRDAVVGDARSLLLMIGGAVCFVLLIACANVANLLLVRATGRKREFAIRAALGAGRGRILRQLLTESILLSSAGGVLGLLLGLVGVHVLLAVSPGNIPRIGENGSPVSLDWRVLSFTLAVSLFTGVLFGFFPALGASRLDLNGTLKESGNRQGAGFRQGRARSLLVISEVSLAIMLLIGAALMIRTFIALREVNPGFDPHNVLTLDMSLAGARFARTASVERLTRDARQRLNAIPGVEVSAATCWPPLESRFGLPFTVVGRPPGSSSEAGDGLWMDVSPGYFDVFKIPILRGRDFTEQDDAAAPPVVLINETMARHFWPGRDPIGQQIIIGKGIGPVFADSPRQIIGVVADTRDAALQLDPENSMIIPQAQEPDGMTALGLQFGPIVWVVRTRVEPHQVAATVAEQLRQASGGLPVARIRSMDEVVLHSTAREDFNMLLLTVFAASALLLAAIGIYGVIAYSVAQRRQEIAIRMAFGADRATIRNMVMRQGMLLAIAGVLLGAIAALGLTRLIASFLFGVKAWDPVAFLVVPALLTSVAWLAIWVPARRAARLDPIRALHIE
jgi:putative ABC transport system permease protein